jgi:arsenate reductase-like glutaredoxin family protein
MEAKTIFYLSTCDTCKRILEDIVPGADVVLQDIKTNPVSADQLEELRKRAGSYLALFSKIARKYRSMGLNEMQLTEADCRKYLLIEYTFLKRPVVVVGKKIFIGNAPTTVEAAKVALHES